MGKWLAAGTIALLALVVLLWLQLRAPADAAPIAPAASAPVASAPAPAAAGSGLAQAVTKATQLAAKPDKMETDTDEFFNEFHELVTPMAMRNAITCYTGGLHTLHRNQKVKLEMKEKIVAGEV